jgi:hypothetical protein
MKVREVYNSIIPKIFGAQAITLYPFIFYYDYTPNRALRNHEYIHIKQIRRDGFLKFYLSYILIYLWFRIIGKSHNVAYLSIPYEKEAYKNQHIKQSIEDTI